jgi:hypothetical protein
VFEGLGRILMILGGVLLVVGVLFTLFGRFLPLGRLPGDIVIRRENFVFYFPVVTMIIVSLLLTFVFSLFRR